MLTDEEGARPPSGGSDEPPFLQEPAPVVPRPPTRTWADRMTDFLDTAQPPVMLFVVATVAGVGLFLFLQQRGTEAPTDPLLEQAATTTTSTTTTTAPASTFQAIPATVGPNIQLSNDTTTTLLAPTTIRRTTVTSAPATTVPETTTTVPPTTEPPTTEPPTTEPPTTETKPPTTDTKPTTTTSTPPTTVEQCEVRIRGSRMYAEPDDDSDDLGRVRNGRYPVVGFTQENGGWVLILAGDTTGWIDSDRIRSVHGACN